MKKLILLLLIIIVTKFSNAQSYGVPDTMAYLQTIVSNKGQFIGQPFSKLMDSLKVQIKYFKPFASLPYDVRKETSAIFAFYYPNNVNQVYLIYPCIEVYWSPFLNAGQSNSFFSYFGGAWNSNVKSFYSTGVIADIKVFD